MTDLSVLTKGSFIGALSLKSLTTATLFTLINKYVHEYDWKDSILWRGFIGSFISSGMAELLMTSIVQRIISLDKNAGIKRIFDQGLNAGISGALNMKAYDWLVKNAPNVEGSKWVNREEFLAQFVSDIVGELLSYYYGVPLLGLNKKDIGSIYA